jgi:proteasome lid subunit RPN8/RPN11
MRLALPLRLRNQVLAEARAAHPGECCGLLVGRREGDAAAALSLHAARNLSAHDDAFEIDPADQFAALRAARAAGLALIGCYHSHPHGAAQPSQADLVGAGEDGFIWLIAAADELAAFVYFNGVFTGADLVTSSS